MKGFNKKLNLKKETIAHLKLTDMEILRGGVDTFNISCIYSTCCKPTEWTCYTGPPMDCHIP